jgi:hypothetical protein
VARPVEFFISEGVGDSQERKIDQGSEQNGTHGAKAYKREHSSHDFCANDDRNHGQNEPLYHFKSHFCYFYKL